MQLSIEGERLLKAQDYHGAIDFFEQGLRVGTDDPEVLSAVYNQLGNAYFYVGKFHKALEYHKKDLETAEKIGDRQGQAKAFGNLGNTFKSLKNFPNAIRCCEAHLEITRELNDKLGEGRACYNLGNVHHAVGKMALTTNDASKQVCAIGIRGSKYGPVPLTRPISNIDACLSLAFVLGFPFSAACSAG